MQETRIVAETTASNTDTRIEQAFQLAVDRFTANDQPSAVVELSNQLRTHELSSEQHHNLLRHEISASRAVPASPGSVDPSVVVSLRQDLHALQARVGANYDDHESRLDNLSLLLSTPASEATGALLTEMASVRTDVDKLKQDHYELQRENADLRDRYGSLRDKHVRLRDSHDRLKAANEELASRLEASQKEFGITVSSLKDQLGVLAASNKVIPRDGSRPRRLSPRLPEETAAAPSYPATVQPSPMGSATSATMPGIPTVKAGTSGNVLDIGRMDRQESLSSGLPTVQMPHLPISASMPGTHPTTPKTMSPRG